MIQKSKLYHLTASEMNNTDSIGSSGEINFSKVHQEKVGSYTLNLSLLHAKKTHETTLSGSRIEEDGAGARSDNSIFKADGEEEEPAFGGRDVKTSTPFKPTAPPLEDSVEEEEEDTTEFSGNLDFDRWDYLFPFSLDARVLRKKNFFYM